MFDWLYQLFMQFVTFVLSLFGMSGEKRVHFEEGLDHAEARAQAKEQEQEQPLLQGEANAE